MGKVPLKDFVMIKKTFKLALIAFTAIAVLACGKATLTEQERSSEEPAMETNVKNSSESPAEEDIVVPAEQSKFYMEATEDLNGKINPKTAGLVVLLQDSKYYAVGERILSVSYSTSKDIVGTIGKQGVTNGGKNVTMNWASEDPVHRPAVGHAPEAAQFGLVCLPGNYSGMFTVRTSRYTYTFTKNISLSAGTNTNVTLDFANPDVQPTRKVGVLGDSISTFDGTMCNDEYSPFYPGSDPNVGTNPDKAVDCKEKTYWWRVIYERMQHGTLDVNSAWSGTRVVHEIKNGRRGGKNLPAGFVDRVYDFVDPDIILIHGGRNDYNQKSPFGEYNWDYPIGQLDINTYCEAYIQTIKALQQRYEGVQIIIIVGDLIGTYETPTVNIAKHFGLPYVNFVGDTIEKCSGSHPTAPAFDYMATKIYNTCKDYLP